MNIKEDIEKIKNKLKDLEATKVRVALFGQPGAGKSSIINNIRDIKEAEVSQRTDTTTEGKEYEWNGLHLYDLPGYGTSRFPKDEYFEKFKIKQQDLFLCVFSGKFHQADTEFFREIREMGKVCIFIRNKRDDIWEDDIDINILEDQIRTDVKKQVKNEDIKIIFTSCRKPLYGFDVLSNLIHEDLEPAKQERWARSAKAHSIEFLKEKKVASEEQIYLKAALSAVNALNPIPGIDMACDVGILFSLFTSIRKDYGLTTEKLDSLAKHGVTASSLTIMQPLIANVLTGVSQTGIIILLKNFAGKQTIKQVTKYIPFIGQAIAGTLGFAITRTVGLSYLEDCHKLAEEILKSELEKH